MGAELGPRGAARFLHEIFSWRRVVDIDNWFLYLCIEKQTRAPFRRRGLVGLFPNRLDWGFQWGPWEIPPLDDLPPGPGTR